MLDKVNFALFEFSGAGLINFIFNENGKEEDNSGANPTIISYYASAVKISTPRVT
jgi:hypothetical protein